MVQAQLLETPWVEMYEGYVVLQDRSAAEASDLHAGVLCSSR